MGTSEYFRSTMLLSRKLKDVDQEMCQQADPWLRLQLVEEVIKGRDALLEALAFPRVSDDARGLGGRVTRIPG